MARKQRNNVDYFPHSVNHGKKMFYLRDKFGNNGYAVWFMLLEQIGKADYHFLDLQDEIQIMYLSSEFKVSESVLKEIIETLVKFKEFDEELWVKESILFNDKFIENISDAYKKRNNNCIDKKTLLSLLPSLGRSLLSKSNPNEGKSSLKGVGNTQSKVKYSIRDKSKENETIKNNTLLSEIKISELEDFEVEYFEIAKAFQELFIKNLEDNNAPTEKLKKVKFKEFTDPIRLMMKNEGATKEQFQTVFKFLSNKEETFWKPIILSTVKLRKNFNQLLLKSKNPNGKQNIKKESVQYSDNFKREILEKLQS